ncbi:MAG: 2,3-dihydroxy-p-cumate/2,3-dihydroxybenzoate 3,4-dioxygenase [Streptosporangiaceae bacterium]|nr:2,3-dihydroxy-p-cumate/2,3-dihydroxybenzoate 3,4-dioxygenase [Streptosporangiaceae bacterium]
MITLTDIAYVRSGVADLGAAVRFATDIVGLELAAPAEAGVAHLRADHRHHCLALVEGPSGVISSGFTVADSDALTAAETELERTGFRVRRGDPVEARSRRAREFIAFDDPFGNRLELVSQQETITRPVAFTRPAGITEFGHLCLDAADVHEAHRFWSTRFNARVSDWIGDAACLLRIDPVHHKLAVFRGDRPGLCHMNFQVATIDDVFRNWHFLIEHGVEIEMGPGRHPQSTAVFLYFQGPEGFTYEYSFGVRRIEDDAAWVPRTFDPDEAGSIDMWLGPVRRTTSQPQLQPASTEPVSTGPVSTGPASTEPASTESVATQAAPAESQEG